MKPTVTFTALAASVLSLANAQNASEAVLPQAVYDPVDSTWSVTVPASWSYTTILEAIGNASVLSDPDTTFSTLRLPFPGFNTTASTYYDGVHSRWLPLVYVNGTMSSYATNAINYGLQRYLTSPAIEYSDESWTLPVTCEWPISGSYSRMNRILYYVLLVFALVVHHHEWLVAGALASATIYSGSAAVQALAQFIVINMKTPHDNAGDNDNEAIQGILAAGLLMAVPLINWSRTLRRLQARPIIIYWALIIFVGYLLVIIGQKQTQFSHGWQRKDGGMMTCNTRSNIPSFHDLGFIDHEFISTHNCNDPCYDPTQQHPLRDASSIIARIDCSQFTWTEVTGTAYSCFSQCPRSIADDPAQTCYIDHDGWTRQDFTLNDIGYYGVLPVVVFELFFVLCFGRRSPEEIRDIMFTFFVGCRMMGDFRAMAPAKRTQTPRSIRVRLAQAGALLFYFFAACTYLVCLPFFVFSVIWQERLLRFFPDAETYYETSQWLPWVGVLLTLGAAVVGKYHHAWHVHVSHLFSRRTKNVAAPIKKAKQKRDTFTLWIRKRTWRTLSRLQIEWRDLKDFVLMPFFLILDEARERTSDHPTLKFAFAGDLPYPPNSERNDRDHYQGPWIRNDLTWKNFPVQFQVEADDRTLRSWEAYQSENRTDSKRVVYSVMLPVVPKHPDRRTVVARATVNAEVRSSMVAYDDASSIEKLPDVTEALVPGTNKRSTIDFDLHIAPGRSAADLDDVDHATQSLHRSDTAQAISPSEELVLLPSGTRASPRRYTPTPGTRVGPLNSHHEASPVGRREENPVARHDSQSRHTGPNSDHDRGTYRAI